jgi:hypothetical protein
MATSSELMLCSGVLRECSRLGPQQRRHQLGFVSVEVSGSCDEFGGTSCVVVAVLSLGYSSAGVS